MLNKLVFYATTLLLLTAGGCSVEKEDMKSGEPLLNESAGNDTVREKTPEGLAESLKAEDVSGGEEKSSEEVQAEKEGIRVTYIQLGSVKCVPCRMMQPIIEEISEEFKGRVNVIFYDVWTPAGRPYAHHYNIRAIPSQIFLDSEGEEYFRNAGYLHKGQILEILKMQGVE